MKRKLIATALILLSSLLLSSCMRLPSLKFKNTEPVLNERQKSILSQANLPTEYANLESPQKRHIVNMEELLQYLDNKYDKEFEYAGYVPAGILEHEHVLAVPTDGSTMNKAVTATRTYEDGEPVIEDDYVELAAMPYFDEWLQGTLDSIYGTDVAKPYFRTFSNVLTQPPSSVKDIQGKISAWTNIFINSKDITYEEFEKNATELKQAYLDNGFHVNARLFYVTDEEFQLITSASFSDFQIRENENEEISFVASVED